MNEEKPIIAERIKLLRKENGYTQEQLADLLGLSAKSSIANYESGANAPSDEVKAKMCEIFGCSMDYLMGQSELKNTKFINIPDLLAKNENYIKNSHMPKINYDILTEDEKNILQDMFYNFAKQVNGNEDYFPLSHYKSKITNMDHWHTIYGIYFIYTKYVYDVFSELNEKFSDNYEKNVGYAFRKDYLKNPSAQLYKVPIVGKITAGQPILAEEHIEGYLPVEPNVYGLSTSEDLFYLRVSGQSMNLKVKNGDYALIHKQDYAEDGDIVVAIVNGDDEATLKRYKRLNEQFVLLEPMSTDHTIEAITIDLKNTKFQIIGKAIGQFGKF